ncbi:hypothetical protein [Flexistipes sinusarabici]|nr:hypothetical protein [Flexistipes sinusarabici]
MKWGCREIEAEEVELVEKVEWAFNVERYTLNDHVSRITRHGFINV